MKRLRSFASTAWEICRHRYVTFACRLVVGTTFIVSGAMKFPERAVFLDEVTKYNLLPDILAEIYGTALPWVEVIVGALLIMGLVLRLAAGIGMLTALSLVIANSVVLYRGLNLECGCFGNLAALQTRDAIVIDSILLVLAFLILIRKEDFLSLDSKIFRRGHSKLRPD